MTIENPIRLESKKVVIAVTRPVTEVRLYQTAPTNGQTWSVVGNYAFLYLSGVLQGKVRLIEP